MDKKARKELIKLIKQEEGTVTSKEGTHLPYADKTGKAFKLDKKTLGTLTIGFGRNLERGISDKAATFLLEEDLEWVCNEIEPILGEGEISLNKKVALMSFLYQQGSPSFLSKEKFVAALKARDFKEAARCISEEEEFAKLRKNRGLKARIERLKDTLLLED